MRLQKDLILINWIIILALILSIKNLVLDYDYLDVYITRELQDLFEDHTRWAEYFTLTAKWPFLIFVFAISAAFIWIRFGLRYIVTGPVSYFIAISVDQFLKLFVYVDKPDSELVYVSTFSTSSGWPSTFAIVYGALFGIFLFKDMGLKAKNPFVYRLLAVLSFSLIFSGMIARIVLGGHWPSQALSSVLFGVLISVYSLQGIKALFDRLIESQ